jgi:hypothetical protein
LQFTQALKDATAVAGVALTPILEVMTAAVREVSATLLPIARDLAPIFQQMAETVSAALLPVLDQMAANLQFLMPVIRFFGDLFASLSPIIQANMAILAGFAEMLERFVVSFMPAGDTLKSFSDMVRDAFQEVAKAAILVAAKLAMIVGATGFVEGMIKSLKGGRATKEDAFGLGAASQASIGGVTDYAATVTRNAFIASGAGAGPKKTDDWLADAVKGLEEIKAGNDQSIDKLLAGASRIKDELVKAITDWLGRKWEDLKSTLSGGLLGGHAAGHASHTPPGSPYVRRRGEGTA